MNFKKAILVTLLISIFLMGAVSAMDADPATVNTHKNSKVIKASLKVSAPKVTNEYKQSQTFKVTVKNKKTGKAIQNVKATIKIDKKTYTKKTNKKGIININTKSLKKGTHKVTIKIKATKKYKKASAKSSIKIVKSKAAKAKIKTHFEVTPRYDYHYDGKLYNVFYKVYLYDEKGSTVKGEIILKKGSTEDWYTYTSGDEIQINEWTATHYKSFEIIFKGNDNYEPCSYTLPVNPSLYG